MSEKYRMRPIALLCWLFFMRGLVQAAIHSDTHRPTVLREILYPEASQGERRRSLDLYLPADSGRKPPLLIFIHGGFWLLNDDQYRIGPAIADAFTRDGIAVALLRYRLAPKHRHPSQAEDIAAGISLLMREADRYGYDAKRMFLAGHSAGGHLAALAALDPTYLNTVGLSPKNLAGVISFSGLYDLKPRWDVSDNQKFAVEQAFGRDVGVLTRASPVNHVRADAPAFLILAAAQDFPGFAIDARRFADALRRAGSSQVQQYMVRGLDHFSLVDLTNDKNPLRGAVLDFMGVRSLGTALGEWVEAKKLWAEPRFSTLPFWRHGGLIRAHAIDQRFLKTLAVIYGERKDELREWPLKQYHAIDLFSYLNALPKAQAGEGDFVTMTNLRNERQVWHRKEIEAYRPVVVVGIDDERNLFRFSTFYHMLEEYSWKPSGRTPLLTMTVGGFIYFQNEPPRHLQAQSWHFGLAADSFRRTSEDPLRAIKDVPREVYDALTYRNGCVYCHSFRGVGSRSHHVQALTSQPKGGFALPLESYPPEVWRRFVFEQEAVAKKMGAFPNLVAESARGVLFELVNQSRLGKAAGRKQ